jgi:hypothetical protein
MLDVAKLVMEAIEHVVPDMRSVPQPDVETLKSHLETLHGKLSELANTITIGASSVPHVTQGNG